MKQISNAPSPCADCPVVEITFCFACQYIDQVGLENASKRIEELKKRVKDNNFSEIIVALNSTPEGRATSILVESTIKEAIPSHTFKITHLAKGIPVGGELEYADEETLENALEGRK